MAKPETYREKALRILEAEARSGVREVGNNLGPDVEKYQRADSLFAPDTGYPWCASFVVWGFEEAGRPLTELRESPSVGQLLNEARSHGWNVAKPARADCVCFYWSDSHPNWPDHIGMVRGIAQDGAILTVEGNTGPDGGGHQGAWFKTRYPATTRMAYFRVPGVIERTPVVVVKPEVDEDVWIPGYARWWGDRPPAPKEWQEFQAARKDWRQKRPKRAPKTLTKEQWQAVAAELAAKK